MVKYTVIIVVFITLSCKSHEPKMSIHSSDNHYTIYLDMEDSENQFLYSIDNSDKTIEIDKEVTFKQNRKKFGSFLIYESSVGTLQTFIYNYSSGEFYISEIYDKQALGDSMILGSFNEKKRIAEVISLENGKYSVSFQRIHSRVQ